MTIKSKGKYEKKYSPDEFFYICMNEWEDVQSKIMSQKQIIMGFLKNKDTINILNFTNNNNNPLLKEFSNSFNPTITIYNLYPTNDNPLQNDTTLMTFLDYQYYLTEPILFQKIINVNYSNNNYVILCLQLFEEGIKNLQKIEKKEFVDYIAKKKISIEEKKILYSFFPKFSNSHKKEFEFSIYNNEETMEKTVKKMQNIGWQLMDEFVLPYDDDLGKSFLCFFIHS